MMRPLSFIGIFFIVSLLTIACDTAKKDWEKAQAEDTIAIYEEYLQKHPEDENANKAHNRLEYLYRPIDWQKAQEANTISAYEDYLKNHPKGEYANKAQGELNELYLPIEFKKAKTSKTIEAYLSFLRKYPKSDEAKEILPLLKPLLYKDACAKNTIRVYENFLKFYPKGLDARRIKAKLKPLEQERNFRRLAEEEQSLPVVEKKRQSMDEYLSAIKPRADFANTLQMYLDNGDITQSQYDELVRRNRKNATPY